MKRLFALAAAATLLLSFAPAAGALSTSAGSAILMDADSGRVLYAQNAHEPRLIASTTKLMTALVAAERCALDEVVTVPREATLTEGSSMYLRTGETLTLETLLYGLLLASGNDAAVAIAIHCAGSVEKFAAWMNEKAAELGMTNSHFVNPNGLNHEDHYSTAYDMALLARACLESETVSAIAATRSITAEGHSLTNHNKLLWQYDGCVGLKTGYTELAGRTLVSAARRNGQTLVAVTLNDRNDWADHAALFDYGFSTYPTATLLEGGRVLTAIHVNGSLIPYTAVAAAETVTWPLAEVETVTVRWETEGALEAPAQAGTVVGEATLYVDDAPVATVPLVTVDDVPADRAPALKGLEKLWNWIAGG